MFNDVHVIYHFNNSFHLSIYYLFSGCDDGDVRLVDGPNPNEGRVEVCIGGVWGTVCSRLWETTDARVVCGQLGYSNFSK